MKEYLLIIFSFFFFLSCEERKEQATTPWGTAVGEEMADTLPDNEFSLTDIQTNGEMIMLTLGGPNTYYDYRGKGMGQEFLLCEKFSQALGVSLRVDVCKDTAEMIRRLKDGEGDIIAYPLPRANYKNLLFCGATADHRRTQWAVNMNNKELADTLNRWFRPELIAQVQKEERFLLSSQSIQRRVYSPMLNKKGGVISHYDKYFQMYAPTARMDWRLMAAQCYQESCFDPNARSWAGACGLMQIMPSTANHLGLSMSQIHDPEANISAAARYMAELSGHFSDIQDPAQRIFFALAAYNGGFFHIRDAMALARKYGRNPYRWGDVSVFVLKLRSPEYYNDPVVKNGYMRGDETVNYVARIRDRWAQYRGVPSTASFSSSSSPMPTKATKKHRFKL